jgi:hypothetical protein
MFMRLNSWIVGMVSIARMATTASVLAEEPMLSTKAIFYKIPNVPKETKVSSLLFLKQDSFVDLWSCMDMNSVDSVPSPGQDPRGFILQFCKSDRPSSGDYQIFSQGQTNPHFIIVGQGVSPNGFGTNTGKVGLFVYSGTYTLSLKDPSLLIATVAAIGQVENEAPQVITDHLTYVNALESSVLLPPLKHKVVVIPSPTP